VLVNVNTLPVCKQPIPANVTPPVTAALGPWIPVSPVLVIVIVEAVVTGLVPVIAIALPASNVILVTVPPASGNCCDCQVVPVLINTLPAEPGAILLTELAPLPTINAFGVKLLTPVPP
jgi:hypothetical protein